MTIRTALFAVLAAVLAVPAAAGLAQTPCDLLPTTNKKEISPEKIEGTLCNACVGLPVPGARDRNGNGLDYNDGAKHWECEIMVGNRGNGQCKRQTICLPGGERFFDNGVMRCRYPAVVITVPGLPANPRDSCERALPLTITELHDDRDLPFPTLYPGVQYLFVRGQGAANATSGEMTGGIGVTVGEAARRLGSRSACLPPDCQDVKLNVPSSAAGPGLGTSQTLKLYTPHRYRSATMTLPVKLPPTPTPIPVFVQQHPPVIGGNISSGVVAGTGPTPTRTPTPQAARDQQYTAGLTCPGTLAQFSNQPTPVFVIRSAHVQAQVSVQMVSGCVWDGTFEFKITGLDGQGDVTRAWQAQLTGNPNQPVIYSTIQQITLTPGRWQIAPDVSFPPGSYTILFRD
jgi:hypothetical protein